MHAARMGRSVFKYQPLDANTAALAAMREARRNPEALSLQQEQVFFRLQNSIQIRRYASIELPGGKFRCGFRRGGDLPMWPAEWDVYKKYLKINREIGRISRQPPASELGVQANLTKADKRRRPVLESYSRYAHRGCHAAALIEKATGEGIKYVQRVLREEKVRDAKS